MSGSPSKFHDDPDILQVAQVMITLPILFPLLLGKFADVHAARSSRLVTSPTKATYRSPPMSDPTRSGSQW
jgi:hypothetical protein